jgi:hydroxypyruvate isomerase
MRSSQRATSLSRRSVLGLGAAAGAGALVSAASGQAAVRERVIRKGRLRQSVCRWCYGDLPLERLVVAAKEMGLLSVELLRPEELPVVAEHGLACAMVSTHGITRGLNRRQHHDDCLQSIRTAIDAAAEHGFPNVITFSGNREGLSDEEGMRHCAEALEKVLPHAESKGLTVCMELLNSKVDHPDYMCDRTAWGVELCRRVGSERFKLLYDIYHMQIMEGDVIRTIRDHHQSIAHYHTAGVPGRHELDEEQELFYPAIMRAILDTGYAGYVGQEFVPTRDDPLASLAHGVQVCDV